MNAVTVLMMAFNVIVLVGSGVEPTDAMGERVGENWTTIYMNVAVWDNEISYSASCDNSLHVLTVYVARSMYLS